MAPDMNRLSLESRSQGCAPKRAGSKPCLARKNVLKRSERRKMARILINGRSRLAIQLRATAGVDSKAQNVKQAAQALNIAFVSAEVRLSNSSVVHSDAVDKYALGWLQVCHILARSRWSMVDYPSLISSYGSQVFYIFKPLDPTHKKIGVLPEDCWLLHRLPPGPRLEA